MPMPRSAAAWALGFPPQDSPPSVINTIAYGRQERESAARMGAM